jgi:hypothetical protein
MDRKGSHDDLADALAPRVFRAQIDERADYLLDLIDILAQSACGPDASP